MKSLKFIMACSLMMAACSEQKGEESTEHESVHVGTTSGALDAVEMLSEMDSTAVEAPETEEAH